MIAITVTRAARLSYVDGAPFFAFAGWCVRRDGRELERTRAADRAEALRQARNMVRFLIAAGESVRAVNFNA